MKPIETEKDVARGAEGAARAPIRASCRSPRSPGPCPFAAAPAASRGSRTIVTSQQISDAAAASIWARFKAAVDPFTPEQFLLHARRRRFAPSGCRGAKVRTLTGIAAAAADGFDLIAVHDLPAEQAVATMTALKGIGPWTAEIYLLFCVGHPDIFPAGDLALQSAVQAGLRMRKRPDEKKLRKIAEKWSPWRGVAARLFWAYYRASRGKDFTVTPG